MFPLLMLVKADNLKYIRDMIKSDFKKKFGGKSPKKKDRHKKVAQAKRAG